MSRLALAAVLWLSVVLTASAAPGDPPGGLYEALCTGDVAASSRLKEISTSEADALLTKALGRRRCRLPTIRVLMCDGEIGEARIQKENVHGIHVLGVDPQTGRCRLGLDAGALDASVRALWDCQPMACRSPWGSAIDTLALAESGPAIDALAMVVERPHPLQEVRREAVWALAVSGGDRAVGALAVAARDQNRGVRLEALGALSDRARGGERRAVVALEGLMQTGSLQLRVEAAQFAARVDDPGMRRLSAMYPPLTPIRRFWLVARWAPLGVCVYLLLGLAGLWFRRASGAAAGLWDLLVIAGSGSLGVSGAVWFLTLDSMFPDERAPVWAAFLPTLAGVWILVELGAAVVEGCLGRMSRRSGFPPKGQYARLARHGCLVFVITCGLLGTVLTAIRVLVRGY